MCIIQRIYIVLYRFVVGVGFQFPASMSVSENDGSVTFTLDINGTVDPGSTTTIYLTASSNTAGNMFPKPYLIVNSYNLQYNDNVVTITLYSCRIYI